MSNELSVITGDVDTRDWFYELSAEIAEATAARAALRGFLMSLCIATRNPQIDLYHWKKTHRECQLALMATIKAVLPFRMTVAGETTRLQALGISDTPWTLQLNGQFARKSLENSHGRTRLDWYEALMFSAAALVRMPTNPSKDESDAAIRLAWEKSIEHAQEDASDLISHDLKEVFSSPLFSQEWLMGDLELFWKLAVSKHSDEPPEGPRFGFWRRWYKALLLGEPLSWEVMQDIAALPEQTWLGEDGLAELAKAIREIEARFNDRLERPENVPELSQKKLLEHVQRLLSSPEMTALAAEGAAETLDRAIAQYLKEAPANCLPETLTHLEGIPGLFRQIARTVKSDALSKAKAEKLASEIEALNAEVARLEAALKLARARTVDGLFTQSALKAAGGAFGVGVVSSIGLGFAHFFGEWPSDITLENLRGWLDALEQAEPAPDVAGVTTGVDV